MLQINPSATLQLMIAHIIKLSWSNWPKSNMNSHGLTRSPPAQSRHGTKATWITGYTTQTNNLYLESNPVNHTTWKYFVGLVIHFTNKTYTCTSYTSWEQPVQSSLSQLSTHDHFTSLWRIVNTTPYSTSVKS